MGSAPEPRRPKVMRVSTRCRTVDELVAAFATLVDDVSMVVLTDAQRAIGTRQPFVVELADGTIVMKGEAEVVESTPPPRGRLRFRFLSLDPTGREVHARMLERKRGVGANGAAKPPRAPTEPGMKALVRIPEVPRREAQTTGMVPVMAKGKVELLITKAPPAPFARPAVPKIPQRPTPVPAPVPAPVPPDENFFDPTNVDMAVPLPAPPPRVEERTPGSPYILPANPFGDVDPASLEAFVECTVYEETGQVELEAGFDDAAADAIAGPIAEPPAPSPEAVPVPAPPPPPPMFLAPSQPQQPPPQPLPLAAPAETGSRTLEDFDVSRKPLPWKWIAAAGAILLGAVIALIVTQLGDRGTRASAGGRARDAAPAARVATDARTAVTAVAPDAGVAVVAVAVDAAPATAEPDAAPEPVDVATGSGECELRVTTEPPDAAVTLGGKRLGQTPLTIAVPCGAGRLAIERPRYDRVEKKINAAAGEAVVVDVRLARPEQRLRIVSKPAGATISVDGRTVGKAPVTTTVRGFTTIKVSASLKGHQTWSQRMYVKKTTGSVTATLKRNRGGRR